MVDSWPGRIAFEQGRKSACVYSESITGCFYAIMRGAHHAQSSKIDWQLRESRMEISKSTTAAGINRLRPWLPAIVWLMTIFALSTSAFSASNTSRIIVPLLHFLFPGASAPTIRMLHGVIRKAAHFTNYGILFWILIHGPMAGRPYAALMLCVCYAFLDEGHQILVPGRTPSLYDVALDSSGALFSRFLNAATSELS